MYIVTDKFTSRQGYQKCYLLFSFQFIFAIEKNEKFLRNLFLRLEEFGNICGTNFCDLGPKSQKFVPQNLMPQHFMPAKINALKV